MSGPRDGEGNAVSHTLFPAWTLDSRQLDRIESTGLPGFGAKALLSLSFAMEADSATFEFRGPKIK